MGVDEERATRIVLNYIRNHSYSTRMGISRMTGIPYWLVLKIVDRLEREGKVVTVKYGRKKKKTVVVPVEVLRKRKYRVRT